MAGPRRIMSGARSPALALALTLTTLTAVAISACGARRTPEQQAAVRAQDACIAALEPVSNNRRPSSGALGDAARDADAAAEVDERWVALRSRLADFRARTDAPEALDALVQECGRVNQIVKEKRSDVERRTSS